MTFGSKGYATKSPADVERERVSSKPPHFLDIDFTRDEKSFKRALELEKLIARKRVDGTSIITIFGRPFDYNDTQIWRDYNTIKRLIVDYSDEADLDEGEVNTIEYFDESISEKTLFIFMSIFSHWHWDEMNYATRIRFMEAAMREFFVTIMNNDNNDKRYWNNYHPFISLYSESFATACILEQEEGLYQDAQRCRDQMGGYEDCFIFKTDHITYFSWVNKVLDYFWLQFDSVEKDVVTYAFQGKKRKHPSIPV